MISELDNKELTWIQNALSATLRSDDTARVASDDHIDEDTFSAFIEGALPNVQQDQLVNHLVYCGFCRNVSADLLRLDAELAETPSITPVVEKPTKLSEVLSGLFQKIFGTPDGAVFAHGSEDENSDSENEKAPKEGDQ